MGAGASCDTACGSLSQTCDVSQMRLVTTTAQMDFALNSQSLQACGDYPEVPLPSADIPTQPMQLNIARLGIFCYEHGESSTCAARASLEREGSSHTRCLKSLSHFSNQGNVDVIRLSAV